MPGSNRNTGMTSGVTRRQERGTSVNGKRGSSRGICRRDRNQRGLRRSAGVDGDGQAQGTIQTRELSRQVADNRGKLDAIAEKLNKLLSAMT